MSDPAGEPRPLAEPWHARARPRVSGAEGAREIVYLPFESDEWRVIIVHIPAAGGFAADTALRVARPRPRGGAIPSMARAERWKRDARRLGALRHDASPVAACAEMQVFFPPPCPSCLAPLEIVADRAVLQQYHLLAEEVSQEYARCPRCSQQLDRAPIYAAEREFHNVEIDAGQPRAFDTLIVEWSEALLAGAGAATDARSSAFPCANCAHKNDCYKQSSAEGTALARRRLAPIHWSDLPPIPIPAGVAPLGTLIKQIELEGLDRADAGNVSVEDPAFASSLLLTFERKLTLLRRLAEAVAAAQRINNSALGGFDPDAIAARGKDSMVILDGGGAVPIERSAGKGHAAVFCPASGGSRQLQRFKPRARLHCDHKSQRAVSPDVVSVTFSGKLIISDKSTEDEQSAFRNFAPHDLCTLAMLDELGAPSIRANLLVKGARAGELVFKTHETAMRPAVAERLLSELKRRIDNVDVYITPMPGYDADLYSLGKIALQALIGYEPEAVDDVFADLDKDIARSRRERSSAPKYTFIELLRGENNFLREAVHPLGLFSKDCAAIPRRGLEETTFPMKLWDEMLEAVSNWLAAPRRDATDSSIQNALNDIIHVERRVRLFRCLRDQKLSRCLVEEGFSRECAVNPELSQIRQLNADAVLDALGEAAPRAHAAGDLKTAKVILLNICKEYGFQLKDVVTALHIIQFGSIGDFAPSALEPMPTHAMTPVPSTMTPSPPRPSPRPIDAESTVKIPAARAGMAFVPLILQLKPVRSAEAAAAAAKLAAGAEGLDAWGKLTQLSVRYIHHFAAGGSDAWPSPPGREAAGKALRALADGEVATALGAATHVLSVVKDELLEHERRLAAAVRAWSGHNALDRLRLDAEKYFPDDGQRAHRDRWHWLADEVANSPEVTVSSAELLRNDLIEEIRRANDAAGSAGLRSKPDPTIGKYLNDATAAAARLDRAAEGALAECAKELMKCTGRPTAGAPNLASQIVSDPPLLLAWVVTSQIGAELLLWTVRARKARNLEAEGAAAQELLSAIREGRAPRGIASLDLLVNIPERLRIIIDSHYTLDSPAWMRFMEQQTLRAAIVDIEKRIPRSLGERLLMRNRGPKLWAQFVTMCDAGAFSAEALRAEFQRQLEDGRG